MKWYKFVLSLIVALMTLLTTSCSKHSCVGRWAGKGCGTQVVYLTIADNGNFTLRILPNPPVGYIQLYQGPETDYEGKWEPRSDDDILLVCKTKAKRYTDYSTKEVSESSDVFYFRKDGAFCKESPYYPSPTYDLMKQESN